MAVVLETAGGAFREQELVRVQARDAAGAGQVLLMKEAPRQTQALIPIFSDGESGGTAREAASREGAGMAGVGAYVPRRDALTDGVHHGNAISVVAETTVESLRPSRYPESRGLRVNRLLLLGT
jgi:hypothetical protein